MASLVTKLKLTAPEFQSELQSLRYFLNATEISAVLCCKLQVASCSYCGCCLRL